MKFSTKSRYALRLMAELARYAPGTTVSLKEISERQNLSLKYLEQIVTPLARVGLVKSERGSQGGYRLTKAPADYTAGEILRPLAMEILPPDTFTLLLFVAYATFALPFTPDTAIFFEVLFVLMPIHF